MARSIAYDKAEKIAAPEETTSLKAGTLRLC
jgi:hypothetical protein